MFDDAAVIAASSRRQNSNMSLNYGLTDGVLDNRRDFLGRIGIDYRGLVCARQVHSANIVVATEKQRGKGAMDHETAVKDADAFITGQRNLPLAVFTADCLAVFLYDPQAPAIGLVHAGWKGSRDNIAAKAVALMREQFRSRPEDLRAGFGPSIGQCCYEVGREFKDYFAYGLQERGNRHYLGLAEVNKKQLLETGLKEKNISGSSDCTFCNGRDYFSFRREGAGCGRMMSVMMLK